MPLTVDSLLPASLPGGWPTVPTLIVGVPVLLALVALAVVHRRARRRAHALAHDVERLEPTGPANQRAEGLARFTGPRPPARLPPGSGSTPDVRARDSLATLMGQSAPGESPSHERRASGTPGWPDLGGVQRATAPAPVERIPDAFSSHPQDRNLHRRRWLERNAEIIRRLDEAHRKAGASQGTLNAIEQELDGLEAPGRGDDDRDGSRRFAGSSGTVPTGLAGPTATDLPGGNGSDRR